MSTLVGKPFPRDFITDSMDVRVQVDTVFRSIVQLASIAAGCLSASPRTTVTMHHILLKQVSTVVQTYGVKSLATGGLHVI